MKIVVIGPFFPDSFARNVSVSLESLGHEILQLEGTRIRHNQNPYVAALWRYLPLLVPSVNELIYAGLVREVANFRPALVLVTYDFFSPEVVERIKKAAQAPVVCWYTDAIMNLRRGGSLFSCPYDAIFCKEPRLVEIMTEKLGLPAHYLPEGCNSQWHRPVTPTTEQLAFYGCDVAAQGTFHYYRAKFFEGLSDFDVKIWGSVAPPYINSSSRRFFQRHYIAEQEKAIAFRSAKILVNAMHYAEVHGVNKTLFEGTGCGAFQICDDRPTLSEFFKAGEEVVTFRSRSDLLEKVRYYLTRDEERKKISERAWQRAHREHTHEHRLTKLIQTVKLG